MLKDLSFLWEKCNGFSPFLVIPKGHKITRYLEKWRDKCQDKKWNGFHVRVY